MTRILVVEDDRDIAGLIVHYLQNAGYETTVLSSGDEVLARVRAEEPGLVILDRMLPGLDGLEICRSLRADRQTAFLPIIVLTARAEESDRIAGLELGADDYITKPFSPKELIARVQALLRRSTRNAVDGARLEYGPLTIDFDRHVVTHRDRRVELTAKEFLLLEYLIKHRGRVLSRDLLLTDVWGYQYTGGTRTVDVHIRRLREKLPILSDAITTIKQFGYRLEDEPLPSRGRERSRA